MVKKKTYLKAFTLFAGAKLVLWLLSKVFPNYDVGCFEMMNDAVNKLGGITFYFSLCSIIFGYLNGTKLAHYQYRCYMIGTQLVVYSIAGLILFTNSIIVNLLDILSLMGTVILMASIIFSFCNLINIVRRKRHREA